MIVKNIIEEDFINYKKPNMFIAFPSCTFKCEKECGECICQNQELYNQPNLSIPVESVVDRYLKNDITSSIVCGGLEPFDSILDLIELIYTLRVINHCNDDIVIYTGYYKDEIADKINTLSKFKNIYIKFGRYIPNQESHFDNVLGIELASNNQYGEKIS